MHRGFTLIEILIVVIILGILAVVVTPMVSSASDDARAAALRDNIHTVRTQCEMYRLEHGGVAPGYPPGGGAPNEATFIAQLLQPSDAEGNVGSPGEPGMDYGPYLQRFPVNAVNGLSTVNVIPDGGDMPAEAGNTFGWVYKPETSAFRADATGMDPRGKFFYEY